MALHARISALPRGLASAADQRVAAARQNLTGGGTDGHLVCGQRGKGLASRAVGLADPTCADGLRRRAAWRAGRQNQCTHQGLMMFEAGGVSGAQGQPGSFPRGVPSR